MKATPHRRVWLVLAISLLSLATAGIHFSLVIAMGKVDPLFTLNGLGYLFLVASMYLPLPVIKNYRRWVRFAFIAFTIVTIIAWVLIGARTTIGYLDKFIELVLVGLLLLERP